MRLAVTGGTGYIGSHVVSALREEGHQVLSIDKNGGDVLIDICQTEKLIEAVRDFKVEIIFHLAAIADARVALAEPVHAVVTNVGGTASVLEACRAAGIKRVILASSYWVGGVGRVSLKDGDKLVLFKGTGDIYTTSKIAAEFLAHDYYKLYGLPFTILRYSTPYGPGMWQGLVLRSFLDNYFLGKPLVIFGDGSATRRFTYIEDLARAHVLALQDVAENQIYDLAGSHTVTIKGLAEIVCRLLPGAWIEYRPERGQVNEDSHSQHLSRSDKAYSELGWEPQTTLEEGVSKTIEWYKANLEQLKKLAVGGKP